MKDCATAAAAVAAAGGKTQKTKVVYTRFCKTEQGCGAPKVKGAGWSYLVKGCSVYNNDGGNEDYTAHFSLFVEYPVLSPKFGLVCQTVRVRRLLPSTPRQTRRRAAAAALLALTRFSVPSGQRCVSP